MPEAVEKQKTEAEELMIPVGEDEKETIVSLEESNIRTVEDQKTPETKEAIEASQPEEELESYSKNVKKRIDKLTRKLRETERREATALEYANNVRSEIDAMKSRANTLDQNYISEYENRVTVQGQAAEKELKNALDAGDSAKIIAANKVLAQVAVEEERIRMTKQQQEVQKQQQEAYAKMAQQQQAGQANNMQAPNMQAPNQPVDPKAEEWARKNDWFGADEVMTYASFGIHANLIEKEGFDANSDEYYDEIDKRMRKAFPHRFNEEEKPTEQRKIAQTVASANKSTGRKKKGVRLTPSQVAIAKKLNVPLEEYAKYVSSGAN